MDVEHIGYALPILLQGSLHLIKETLRLAAFLYGLPFLGSETTHHLFEFLCTLTTGVGGNHFLIEVITFQFGIELGDLLFQAFHLVEEFLHILPFLRVRTLQSRRPQVGVFMKRCLGLHLLGVKINLAIYCESIDLSVLGTKLLYLRARLFGTCRFKLLDLLLKVCNLVLCIGDKLIQFGIVVLIASFLKHFQSKLLIISFFF